MKNSETPFLLGKIILHESKGVIMTGHIEGNLFIFLVIFNFFLSLINCILSLFFLNKYYCYFFYILIKAEGND